MRKALTALFVALVATAALASAVSAAPDAGKAGPKAGPHDLPHPLGDKQRALRAAAAELQLNGQIPPGTKVARVAKGQYVELAREGEDSIWTVLGEFGPNDHPAPILFSGVPGPLHNEIPEPDRSVDNSTIWTDDFSEEYFEELLFSEVPGAVSMRNFYIAESSGRYAVNGDVTDWVEVPYNAAAYGRNYCGGIVCAQTWVFVNHSIDAWYNAQIAAGKTQAQINADLARYDVWDRYDIDGDGNFDEPDGYIDHFQSVHAGEGEETGGGAQGSDAIWSHRWYAYFTAAGPDGPGPSSFGGVRIGNSNYWVGDYTIEPENGGVGVFAHEFAHDLGLPDLYDTSGNVGGAENSTGFWTLMSSGSYGNSGEPEDGIGTKPIHMGAWEKFQLGWNNYEVAFAGRKSEHRLGPAFHNTKAAQTVFVVLPDKQVTLNLGAPYAGAKYYYSGNGDNLDNFMYRQVTLPSSGASLSAQVRYEIEDDWDYAYLVVSTDGGSTWTSVQTSESTSSNPNGQNFGHGITGDSGGNWVNLTADLSAYNGQTVMIGFRYWTDGAVVEPGFQADEIAVGGSTYGAEADGEFTLDGFRVTTGSEQTEHFNAYVVENRQYGGYDDSLRTGPYNFGFLNTLPNWVEHFAYEDGVLISYWDNSHSDNNVGDHPGEGLLLPIDAHPGIEYWGDGTMIRPRIQSYDSTFGLEPTTAITVHQNGVPKAIASKPAVSIFDDRNSYWTGGSAPGRYQPGWSSVKTPNTGTQVRVKGINSTGFAQIEVRPAK